MAHFIRGNFTRTAFQAGGVAMLSSITTFWYFSFGYAIFYGVLHDFTKPSICLRLFSTLAVLWLLFRDDTISRCRDLGYGERP